MFVITGKIAGKVQMMMPAAVTAIKRWLSLLLSSGIIKKFAFAAPSFSGVCLVMVVKAKLNFEVCALGNGLDGSLALSRIGYVPNMLEVMPLDMPEDGKCYPGMPNIVSELQRETRIHEMVLTDIMAI